MRALLSDGLAGAVVRPCRRSDVCLSAMQNYLRLAKPVLSPVESQDWRAGRGRRFQAPARPLGVYPDQRRDNVLRRGPEPSFARSHWLATCPRSRFRQLARASPRSWQARFDLPRLLLLLLRAVEGPALSRRRSLSNCQLPTPPSSSFLLRRRLCLSRVHPQRRRSRNVQFDLLVPAAYD